MIEREFRRLLVAVDASPHGESVAAEAARLARSLQAELAGLFVMDSELLRLAGLPLAAEVGLTSVRRRRPEPRSMERQLKLEAQRARLALEEAAERYRLRSTFRVTRGEVTAELLAAAREADLLAMGLVGQMGVTGRRLGTSVRAVAAKAPCPVLLLPPAVATGKPILAVVDTSPAAAVLWQPAAALAAALERPLHVLVGDNAAEDGALEAELADAVAAGVTMSRVPVSDLATLSAAVALNRPFLTLLSADSPILVGNEAQLGELACPLLIWR